MSLRIASGRPPNFDAIAAVFQLATRSGTIFTYGDTVYVSDGTELSPALKAHEAVHVDRQRSFGRDLWWERYLKDAEFRLAEELPAHRAEYQTFRSTCRDPNARSRALNAIAARLSGPLYGGLISLVEARRRIA
jgi:hypothetical protein